MAAREPRGFLTKREREFLRGGASDVSNPRQIRQQIRERFRASLRDMTILFDQMEDRDLRQSTTSDQLKIDFAYERSLALLYRMADLADDELDFETALWNGISEVYNRHRPNRAVEINVEISDMARKQVLQQAQSKIGSDQPLTDTELRVLLEDPDVEYREVRTHVLRTRMASSQQLVEYVRTHPTVIGDGFEILEQEQNRSGSGPTPDLLGRDEEDRIVIVEVNARGDNDAVAAGIEELEHLIREYGGEDRVRGVLVAVAPADSLEVLLEDSPVEYRSLAKYFNTEGQR